MAPFSFDIGLNLVFYIVFLSFSSHCCMGSNKQKSESLARGWGDHFHWETLSDGFQLAEKLDKPIMLIIHKTWCRACKKLKGDFAKSPEIAKLAENFIMVNTEDDEEPQESKYAPDGGYIPRILFVDSKADVKTHHVNDHGHHQYRFFYSNSDQLYISMRKVLDTWRYNKEADQTVVELDGQVYDEL